jgi:hypothetical protein
MYSQNNLVLLFYNQFRSNSYRKNSIMVNYSYYLINDYDFNFLKTHVFSKTLFFLNFHVQNWENCLLE